MVYSCVIIKAKLMIQMPSTTQIEKEQPDLIMATKLQSISTKPTLQSELSHPRLLVQRRLSFGNHF